MVEMVVQGIAVDEALHPVLVLRDHEKSVRLPIWIGASDAQAIKMELEGIRPPRPITHDLLRSILEKLMVKVGWVSVIDIADDIFYATITLWHDGEDIEIDARPSDAIAIALKTSAPIYVEDKVIAIAGQPVPKDPKSEEIKKFRKLIEGVQLDG